LCQKTFRTTPLIYKTSCNTRRPAFAPGLSLSIGAYGASVLTPTAFVPLSTGYDCFAATKTNALDIDLDLTKTLPGSWIRIEFRPDRSSRLAFTNEL